MFSVRTKHTFIYLLKSWRNALFTYCSHLLALCCFVHVAGEESHPELLRKAGSACEQHSACVENATYYISHIGISRIHLYCSIATHPFILSSVTFAYCVYEHSGKVKVHLELKSLSCFMCTNAYRHM